MDRRLLREENDLQGRPRFRWSEFEQAMVPITTLEPRRQPRGVVGLMCKDIRDAFPDKADECGIYEWQARKEGQPNRIVYVGSTCRCRRGSLRERILEYCRSGSHKSDEINDALRRGYELWVRVKTVPPNANGDPVTVAEDMENDLLDRYDYAWNKRRNGGRRGMRNILP